MVMSTGGGTPPPQPNPAPTPAPNPSPSPSPTPVPGPGGGLTLGQLPGAYALVASYETVQALSPTTTVDVQYCTIQTNPSGVIASTPVQYNYFTQGTAGPYLTGFASAIEAVMTDPRVIAGTGAQTIDPAGLLQDAVVFTVQYVDPVLAPYGVTADATVPVSLLASSGAKPIPGLQAQVTAIIDATYANLQAAAAG